MLLTGARNMISRWRCADRSAAGWRRSFGPRAVRLPVTQPADAVHAPLGIRHADRVLEASQAESGYQVRQVIDAILDGDDLAHFVVPCAEVTNHDPVLRLAVQRDDDLGAVGEVPRLGVVVKGNRSENTFIERLEEPEDLDEHHLRALGETAKIAHRLIEERDPLEPEGHSVSRSIPNSSAASASVVRLPWSAVSRSRMRCAIATSSATSSSSLNVS